MTSLRQLIGELTTEITMLGEVIADLLAGHHGYRVIQRLPGIGPVLAAVIIAEIGDVTRFKTAAQLSSWAGLTPRHRESDTRVIRGHATKQGSQAAAMGADRGDPARPGRVQGQRRKDAIIARRGTAGPQHRQGRRRPAAARPGLLRAARRPDPLPAPASPGRVSAPATGPGARPPFLSVPRHRAARTSP